MFMVVEPSLTSSILSFGITTTVISESLHSTIFFFLMRTGVGGDRNDVQMASLLLVVMSHCSTLDSPPALEPPRTNDRYTSRRVLASACACACVE